MALGVHGCSRRNRPSPLARTDQPPKKVNANTHCAKRANEIKQLFRDMCTNYGTNCREGREASLLRSAPQLSATGEWTAELAIPLLAGDDAIAVAVQAVEQVSSQVLAARDHTVAIRVILVELIRDLGHAWHPCSTAGST